MGLYDTVMGDTVGVVWSAVSGTVDPWTKANIVADETDGITQAGGDASTAADQATTDVTATLKTFGQSPNTPGGSGSADPSDFTAGVSRSISNLGSLLTSALSSTQGILIAVAIAAVALFLLLGRAKSVAT